jgi:hypothetical protein
MNPQKRCQSVRRTGHRNGNIRSGHGGRGWGCPPQTAELGNSWPPQSLSVTSGVPLRGGPVGGQSLLSYVRGVQSCHYEGPVGPPAVRPSCKWSPSSAYDVPWGNPLACWSSAARNTSEISNCTAEVVDRHPQKMSLVTQKSSDLRVIVRWLWTDCDALLCLRRSLQNWHFSVPQDTLRF